MKDIISYLYSTDELLILTSDINSNIDFYRLKYYKKYVNKLIQSMNEKEFKDFHRRAISNKTARTFEKFLFKYFYKYSIDFIKKEDFNKTKKKESKDVVKQRVQKYRDNNKSLKSLQLMVSSETKNVFDMVRKENKLTGNEVLTILLQEAGYLK